MVLILAGFTIYSTPTAQTRVLVFSGLVGFRHESIPAMTTLLQGMAAKRKWVVDTSSTTTVFTDANLLKYDVVVWNNSCGNDPATEFLTPLQKTAFEKFIQSGKGYAGIHCSSCAGSAGSGWPWYNTMIGAINTGHPSGAMQFQTASLIIENRNHPATNTLPVTWQLKDEWFYYDRSPRESVTVLISLDEKSYQAGSPMGDHPISWCRKYKGGRMFYTGIGHMQENYIDTNYQNHLAGGIQWAADGKDANTAAAILPTGGLILDLDADKGVTLEDGTFVGKWKNQVASFPAQDFVKNDGGRTIPGSGRPTLKTALPALNGHNTLSFISQELINRDEKIFDTLTTGKGYTWFSVMSPYTQIIPATVSQDINIFFGNLKNGGNYEGFWGGFDDNNKVWCGSRNSNTFGRWNADNPKIYGPILTKNQYYIVAGRMGSGVGKVPIEIFVNQTMAESKGVFPVNRLADASQMAIGTERNAIEHPGGESFEGEISRFLMYDRPLSDLELAQVFQTLKQGYFKTATGIQKFPTANQEQWLKVQSRSFDLTGRALPLNHKPVMDVRAK